ncbi:MULTISPECIES: energy transducer TonB [unclassified Acidiphilium]|uniref:energy transducer TonB n=1 Tax=unclassified Acidiphilium TaxID=2617493 RepID=UPI000BC5024C|nr:MULTISPECIES: energy transducer TonB [unclassified Acidiphilium]OYV57723.1 MAG: energy transducer TonB [Acidiphilium sp. 20-67-58]HQT60025.1 energy transducer TonB [Acidiphilium sp.]
MNTFRGVGDGMNPLPEDRFSFPLALVVALALELGLVLFVAYMPPSHVAVAPHPQVTRIKMLAPPPKPKPLPPPPKPVPPPPKPLPPPPKPQTPPPPPLPKPPVPVPPPRPLPKPRPRPVPHHVVHQKPKPLPRTVPKPVAPPPPKPQPVPAAVQETALESYAGAVHAAVQADLKVPRIVEMMQLSGVTELALRIAPDGHLLSVSVIRSSGAPPIDRAALAAVHSTHLPPFSSDMPHQPITVTIFIRLRSR